MRKGKVLFMPLKLEKIKTEAVNLEIQGAACPSCLSLGYKDDKEPDHTYSQPVYDVYTSWW